MEKAFRLCFWFGFGYGSWQAAVKNIVERHLVTNQMGLSLFAQDMVRKK